MKRHDQETQIIRSDKFCNQTKVLIQDARKIKSEYVRVAHGKRFAATTLFELAEKIDAYKRANNLTFGRMF